MELTGNPIKSKQTIFNWLKWIGSFHPATLLERAGVSSKGYFQEDEGFQKEFFKNSETKITTSNEFQRSQMGSNNV